MLDMESARTELLAALADVGPTDWQRRVPYGSTTLHDLLAHLASADQIWAVAAQGLLKGEGEVRTPRSAEETSALRRRAVERGRRQTPAALLHEMDRRRRLLLSLYELLEPRHLALALRSYGERHNAVRERIWLGYHDRLHAADVRRALRMNWHPPERRFSPAVEPVVAALDPNPTLYVIYSVDPVFWECPSPLPGWTYRQLLAHLATGDWVLQHHLRDVIERNAVADWPDISRGNAERLAQREHSTDRALTEEYLSMRHETLLLISQLKREHLELSISLAWEPRPSDHNVLDYLRGFPMHDRSHAEQLRPAMRYVRAMGGG